MCQQADGVDQWFGERRQVHLEGKTVGTCNNDFVGLDVHAKRRMGDEVFAHVAINVEVLTGEPSPVRVPVNRVKDELLKRNEVSPLLIRQCCCVSLAEGGRCVEAAVEEVQYEYESKGVLEDMVMKPHCDFFVVWVSAHVWQVQDHLIGQEITPHPIHGSLWDGERQGVGDILDHRLARHIRRRRHQ